MAHKNPKKVYKRKIKSSTKVTEQQLIRAKWALEKVIKPHKKIEKSHRYYEK